MRPKAHPSPNCGPRRDGLTPSLVVLHHTAMADTQAALERLCDPAAEVSAHYLICRSGRILQLVDEGLRAWHAGEGEWQGQADVNSRSIGIELDNDGRSPFPEPQMTALETLLSGILARWSIPPEGVIGHSDLAPGRKHDPGPHFDWSRLAACGLAARPGAHPPPDAPDPKAFRTLAQASGYTAPVDDATLLTAVRLRWRPTATGPLQPDDFVPLPAPTRRT